MTTAFPVEAAANYYTDLAQVYGAYQRLLAIKDACYKAAPRQRSAIDKSYAAWSIRHTKLLKELDERITAMIRHDSKDEKDYSKNVGKYEGARLQERKEGTQAFLALPSAEIEQLCRELPKTLDDTDLEKEYAEELVSIRNHR